MIVPAIMVQHGFRIANRQVWAYMMAVIAGNEHRMKRAFLFVMDSVGIGGSADAAAALKALSAFWDETLPSGEAVLALGADVPVCLLARAARMQGIGEAVAPVALPPLPCVLANPRAAVPTGPVFAALARKDNPGLPAAVPAFADVAGAAAWLARQRNDLEPPARRLEPVIDVVLKTLAALPGALLTRMSGSGATCFALFATQPEAVAAAHTLRRAHPGWWVADTLLS